MNRTNRQPRRATRKRPINEYQVSDETYFKITTDPISNLSNLTTTYTGKIIHYTGTDANVATEGPTINVGSKGFAGGAFRLNETLKIKKYRGKWQIDHPVGDKLVYINASAGLTTSTATINGTIHIPFHSPESRGSTVTVENMPVDDSSSAYVFECSSGDLMLCQFIGFGRYSIVQLVCP